MSSNKLNALNGFNIYCYKQGTFPCMDIDDKDYIYYRDTDGNNRYAISLSNYSIWDAFISYGGQGWKPSHYII